MVTSDISEMINEKCMEAYFQPIASVAEKRICGVEGLIRGIDKNTGEKILPLYLFHAAERCGVQTELDRACREIILQTYKEFYIRRKDVLLFLNLHSSILDKAAGSNNLINMVRCCGISPGDVVIEINESRVMDIALLKNFVDIYRGYGFLIALDDVGCGFSNMDRIPLVKPDIVKVDMSLVRDICTDFYVKEVFKAMVSLSTKIGALVVAEGVETEEEAIQTFELGANMIQGYYLSKPQRVENILSQPLKERLGAIVSGFQHMEKEKHSMNRRYFNYLNSVTSDISGRLELVSSDEFTCALFNAVTGNDIIECAYIVDENGMQISDTVFSDAMSDVKRNSLFMPAKTGDDHTLKIYYRYIKNAKVRKYLTEPYVSLSSGNLCVTFAKTFFDRQHKSNILCIDFRTDGTWYP